MSHETGMLSLDDLRRCVAQGTIDTVDVAFTDHYGRLMGKSYDAGFFLEEVGTGEAHACDYLLTVDMDMEPMPGFDFASWEKGYGDLLLAPDLGSLRLLSWRESTALVLCDVVTGEDHDLVPVAPRSVLRAQLQHVAALGLETSGASELEFFVYEDSYREASKANWHKLTPSSTVIQDYNLLNATRDEHLIGAMRRHLAASGVPVENSKGEWGLGQHELNIRHCELLAMADRHVVYKQCAKDLANQLGQSLTFMAKPHADGAGSSCHVHLSLWRDEQNAFAGDGDLEGIRCSDEFRWFLGGWMGHLPELMALYAPTVNSYKRFQAGSWAPTSAAWGYDNRTAGFRVVGRGQSLRIECRIPGADCNPYLVFAAALAAGLDGIAHKTEPEPMFRGDAYKAEDQTALPVRLEQAVERFESSAFTRAAFGDAMVEHYSHFLRREQAAYDSAVTDWERRRYFEQI
jgi:glutamine synthetase